MRLMDGIFIQNTIDSNQDKTTVKTTLDCFEAILNKR